MKSFPTQPRLNYFVLSSLILVSLRGVTSQDDISINYSGADVVSVGTKITFTGTTMSAIQGDLPDSLGFYGRKENDSNIFQICVMDYGTCGASPAPPCYCTDQNGDTYNFTMEVTATLERSEIFIRGSVGGSDLARYPIITAQTTTKPPTTGTSTDSTDVTNDNVTFTTVTTGGPTTETTTDENDNDHALEIGLGVAGVIVVVVMCVVVGVMISKKKKESASVTSDQPSDSPAEEASTVHSTIHNTLTSSKPEDKDKVEMTEEKKKKKSKKSTKAGSPKKKKKDFENGEKKMDENEPRCLPQPEPVAEPGLSTSLSNPEALKSNFATTRLSSPPSNTRPTSIEMTSAPRPLPSPRNPNM